MHQQLHRGSGLAHPLVSGLRALPARLMLRASHPHWRSGVPAVTWGTPLYRWQQRASPRALQAGSESSGGRTERPEKLVQCTSSAPADPVAPNSQASGIAGLSCKVTATAALCALVVGALLAPGRAQAAERKLSDASASLAAPAAAPAAVACCGDATGHTALAAVSASAATDAWRPGKFLYLINYRFLQILSLPTTGKVAALVCVGLPLVVGGAAVLRWASGDKWGDALTKVYYVLNSVPGADITKEETNRGVLVLNIIHILSLFTFAILVGILTDEVARGVEAVRTGNHAVPEKRHTVIIGWDQAKTPLLLKQLLQAQADAEGRSVRFPCVVLLDPSQCSKEEVDQELEEAIGRTLGRDVVTRTGSSLDPTDLQRVSAGDAGTVIVTCPSAGADTGKADNVSTLVATLAALNSVGSPDIPQAVVVESSRGLADWNETPAGTAICRVLASRGRHVTAVADTRDLTDVLAQSALHPGLTAVFEEVCLQAEGHHEFYILKDHKHTGTTFREARIAHRPGLAVGVCDTLTGKTRLNPAESYVIQSDDSLVFLALNAHQLQAQSRVRSSKAVAALAATPPSDTAPTTKRHTPRTQRVVVIMHDPNTDGTPSLLRSLREIGSERPHIDLVGRVPDDSERTAEITSAITDVRQSGCKLHWIKEEPTYQSALISADVSTANTVVISPPGPNTNAEDTDAKVLACALQLTELLHTSKIQRTAPLRLVAGVATDGTRQVLDNLIQTTRALATDPSTNPLPDALTALSDQEAYAASCARMNNTLVAEMLRVDNLTIGLLGQVAAEPLLLGVFEELLSQEGAELYTRSANHFQLPVNENLTWHEVSDRARVYGELAIGIVDPSGGVRLGERAFDLTCLGPEDRIVVLADE